MHGSNFIQNLKLGKFVLMIYTISQMKLKLYFKVLTTKRAVCRQTHWAAVRDINGQVPEGFGVGGLQQTRPHI